MNKDDFEWWTNFRESKHAYLVHDEYLKVCEIYARTFDRKLQYFCKGCGGQFQKYIDEINVEYQKLILKQSN
jgi:hypothetical protein